MKTNTTIVKALAFAMLFATACNKSEIANEENTEKKGFALPVTVNVTREGDDATKATYNESTRKLEFSAGDKLFVSGMDGGLGNFAGTLTWTSGGTFSGTIYTQNEYSGTADALFSAANDIYATLLPNGYESYNFLSIIDKGTSEKYDDEAVASLDKAFVASETAKAKGVEQFSFEKASNYSSGFALAPQFAILNFTISGLEAGAKDVTLYVTLTDGPNITVTGSVTPNASGVATFAVGVPGGFNIKDISNNLTVGSHNFTLPSTALAAGHIYNITRSAAPSYPLLSAATTADYGKVVCAAGHLHDAKTAVPDGCTAVGIIGMVTETGHGLILALQNATSQNWYSFNGWTSVTTYAGTTLTVLPDDDARGSSLTSYTTLGAITVSNWAVAQKSAYEAIFINLGSETGDYDGTTYDDNVNAYITTGVGGTAISDHYWSATEYDGSYAWAFESSYWYYGDKNDSHSVRPVLGF